MSAVSNNNKNRVNIAGKRCSVVSVKRKKKKKNGLTPTGAEISRHHYISSLDKQLIFQDIVKQFADWPTWQKRLILCRFAEKTSLNLLTTLSTVLEPIFHRDFEIKSKDGFHCTLIKTFLDPTGHCTSLTTPTSSVNPLPSFPESSTHPSPPTPNDAANYPTDKRNSTSQQENWKSDHRFSISSSSGGGHTQKYGSSRSQGSSAHSHNSVVSASTVGKKLSVCTKNFKRRPSLKALDKNFNMLAANIDNTLNSTSLMIHRGISHSHIIHRNSGSLSTMEFLQSSQKQNISKLGQLVKPVNKNGTTHVKQYKHQKWWLPPIHSGPNLQRASKRNLLRSFKRITDEFVHKYTLWSNAEKGDFMLSIVDYCLPDEIIFFANCIYQRLQRFNNINNVSDNVLLNIFSYLEINDLIEAGQVCQRWKYLTSTGHIWEKKCYNLAYENGQLDIMKNLEMSSVELDWKQLYYELEESISLLKSYEKHNISISNQISTVNDESVNDVASHHSEEMVESCYYGENSADIHADDCSGCDECKDDVVHNHLSFEQDDKMFTIMSKDDIEDEYTTEEEATNTLEDTSLEEKMERENDVAFDVRVRLVQACNQMRSAVARISLSNPHVEADYRLIQVNNIKTVNRVRKLEGHEDAVLCLQFDSKRVMTGSSDRTVRIWDIRSGRFFHSLVGHQGGVRCLKFDKSYIVTGSWDTTVKIWDVVDFTLICTITEHSNCVSCVELNSDVLITASHDTSVCIFKKHSWQLLSRLAEHTAPVSCMSLISPEELLTGSHDRTLILWDLNKLCVLRKFEGLTNACLCVKVCGSLVAAGGYDGTITFWNLVNSEIEGRIVAHNGPVNALCFVESRFFTTGSDNVVREWDLFTCTCMRSLRGHTGPVLCLRASSKRVVSGSEDGTSRIWDMAYKLQQMGGNYDELNKNIIPTQVLNEKQFKKLIQEAK